MTMTIEHGLGVAGQLLRQTKELQEEIGRGPTRLAAAREIAEELKLQCGEFATSDTDFGMPIVFDVAPTAASYVAETLTDRTYADEGVARVLAARGADELAAILTLGIKQLRNTSEVATPQVELGAEAFALVNQILLSATAAERLDEIVGELFGKAYGEEANMAATNLYLVRAGQRTADELMAEGQHV